MLKNAGYDKNVKQMFSELDEKTYALFEKRVSCVDKRVLKLKSNAKRSSIAFNTYVPVRRGSVTLVSGPNGSGKTSFLQSFLNDLDVPERKIALGTRNIENWKPFVDEVYGCPSTCGNIVAEFIADVDKIVDEINSANGKNFLIVVDSMTDIVEKIAVMQETKSAPSYGGGLRPETLDLLGCICNLAGYHSNGCCVTIIGTLLNNERDRRQTIISEQMIRYCSAYITLCTPNSNFDQIGELSVDYLKGKYIYYGQDESELYHRIRNMKKPNDYLNTLVNKTNTFIMK